MAGNLPTADQPEWHCTCSRAWSGCWRVPCESASRRGPEPAQRPTRPGMGGESAIETMQSRQPDVGGER